MSLSILSAAREEPNRIALIDEETTYTFEELAPYVTGAAKQISLRRAAEDDPDRPAVLTGTNTFQTLVRLYALMQSGIPALLLHPRLTERERLEIVRSPRPAILLDDLPSLSKPALSPPEKREPVADHERPLVILYTSGTEGAPKGVVLSRRAFLASARGSAQNLGWQNDDRWLLCMPLAHVGGLSIVTRCLIGRRTVVLERRFDPESVRRTISRHRITLLSLVPTMVEKLLDLEPRWSPPKHLRAVLVGGSALSRELRRQAVRHRLPILTTYGLTEASSQVTAQRYGTAGNAEPGSGLPIEGTEVRVRQGRIQIRGPTLMTTYFPEGMHPTPFTESGWMETGDCGRFDREGRLYVLGRREEIIVTGGENVSAREVERVLEGSPGVRSACVFGKPDETWGEIVCAALVASDQTPPAPAEFMRFVAERLAPHKRPRLICFLPFLPRNRSGKIDRAAVAKMAPPLLRPLGQPHDGCSRP